MSPDREAANAGQILQFLTTEHFTLQTERASASSDVNARVQLYMSALSATLISLALVAQLKGYRCVFVCPDKVSEDKRNVLRAYGAEVVVCPTAV